MGKFVQGGFKGDTYIWNLFFKCMQHTHEYFSGFGARIGLGTEADFSCDDQRPKFTLGEVVVGRNRPIGGPVIKSVGFFSKDVLCFLDRRVPCGTVCDLVDFLFDFFRLLFELFVAYLHCAQAHGIGRVLGKLLDE